MSEQYCSHGMSAENHNAKDCSRDVRLVNLCKEVRVTCWCLQDHGLETGLDITLIPRCAPALPFGTAKPVPVYIEAEAINTQRAIGTTLSHEVCLHSDCGTA